MYAIEMRIIIKNNVFFLSILLLILTSCKNYYNDAIEWTDNLEAGINIENVKKFQSDFIEIDWENPQIINNEKWFLITKIKGNKDILEMSIYLVFVENYYLGREIKK